MLASYISPSNRRFASALNSCVLTSPSFAAFTPLSLFSGGVQGVWYDPSDLSTMFEDSAGTTAVHTPGNGTADSPVGKILDKSGNGNHATQSTSTKRPTLSAKYNLLTYTEDFSNAAWVKNDVTATADTITSTSSTSNYTGAYQFTASVTGYTHRISAKAGTAPYLCIGQNFGGAGNSGATFDVLNGVVLSSVGGTASMVDEGGGWWTCILSNTTVALNTIISIKDSLVSGLYGGWGSGTCTSGKYIYVRKADTRLANDGVGLPAYQRVVDANTYDSAGFPYYLKSDGVDDAMVTTGNVDFTSTNAVDVFPAV